tara:strand:+ start:1171 stop:2034 length:864 start_codon:yes stop_codon:yes gene_type:complete
MITCGSLFAGIGGFELGAQWAFESAGIPHKVLFQVEQNKYCQKILKKHWPDAQIFEDVRAVGRHNLPDIDILMGGFPCQDISVAGHQKGIINGKKSGLWFEMLRIISELRPAIAVLENVPAILRLGGSDVVRGLAEIGYDCEWQIISAAQFGAPHLRRRWFCVATDSDRNRQPISAINAKTRRMSGFESDEATDTDSLRSQVSPKHTESTHRKACRVPQYSNRKKRGGESAWGKGPIESALCSVDDGIPNRLARLRALGNAIVPQCSEFIFNHIIKNVLQSQQQKEQ